MYKIMIVEDNLTNLSIAKKALEKSYDIIPATSGNSALNLLKRVLPDLILLDIKLPDINGFNVISQLKTSQRLKNIPVIFLTAQDDISNELEGLSLGAVDYIKKPFLIPLLIKRVELHIRMVEQNKALEDYNKNLVNMVQEKTKTIIELQQAIITTIADLIEKKDGYTGGHIVRTQTYFTILLKELIKRELAEDLKEEDIDIISLSAKLYDVGKIGIPDKMLLNTNRLDSEEIEYMKLHTVMGAKSIEKSAKLNLDNNFLNYALQMARSHHEKWNGTGYPDGLSGKDIPLVARILAIVDIYDALLSERGGRPAFSHEQAVSTIIKNSGTFFDPTIIEVFQSIHNKFPLSIQQ